MRRLILCVAAVCAVAAPSASMAPAKSGNGVMCVLHAKLAAENDTGSTSIAKGHTQIKVRNSGTIEFKTHILNKNAETFVAGHIHQAPVGVAGPVVVPLFVAPAPATNARHIKQSRVATPKHGHNRRRPLPEPKRLLRQLPHDRVSGRRDPRPAALAIERRGAGE